MTFKVIRGQGQGHVRLKVSKMTIFKIYPSTICQPIKKIPMVSDTRPNYLKPLGPDYEFPPSYRVTWLQSLPKNQLRPILMKLGTMLEVDETLTTIWLSRSSKVRVKVRRWPQSPVGTIFVSYCMYVVLLWARWGGPGGIEA